MRPIDTLIGRSGQREQPSMAGIMCQHCGGDSGRFYCRRSGAVGVTACIVSDWHNCPLNTSSKTVLREAILAEIEDAIITAESVAKELQDFNVFYTEGIPWCLQQLLFYTIKAQSLISMLNVQDTGQSVGYFRNRTATLRTHLAALKSNTEMRSENGK